MISTVVLYSIKMSKMQMKKLFHFATSQTHFSYLNQYYNQVNGVAMDYTLGSTHIDKLESKWLSQLYLDYSPLYFRSYVDDIFVFSNQKNTWIVSYLAWTPNILT